MNVLTMKKNPNAPLPEWERTVFFEDDGDIFIPAPVTGHNEERVFMDAGFDGVPVVQKNGHVYFPLSWAEKVYPKEKELYLKIKTNVDEARREMAKEAFFKHQSVKLEFLRDFKKGSSSELSFFRRVAGLSILDALCALTGREADSLFVNAEGIDFLSLIKENKDHPLVEVFMLSYGIDPNKDELSNSDEESITHAISQLTKLLVSGRQL